MYQVVVRTDASRDLGAGHVMRCLTLADELARAGVQVTFLSVPLPGNLFDVVLSRGHRIVPLEGGSVPMTVDTEVADSDQSVNVMKTLGAIDWVVVDHYGLGASWERSAKSIGARVLAIDDMADRHHDCALLIDQTFGRNKEDYRRLVNGSCRLLLGSEYALVRPEFRRLRNTSIESRRGRSGVRRIFVSFGGSAIADVTALTLDALEYVPGPQDIDVVVGWDCPFLETLQERARCTSHRVRVYAGLADVASVMGAADFGIGAAGTMSWERCTLGLPSAVILLAENQRHIARNLSAAGAAWLAGEATMLDARAFGQNLAALCSDHRTLVTMAGRAASICDGRGSERVCAWMRQ